MPESRQSLTLWSVLILAILFAFGWAVAARGQEIARVSASGEVVVERSGSVLRVVIPTEHGRIIVEVPPTPGVPPELPPPGTDPEPPAPEPEPEPDTPQAQAWRKLAERIVGDAPVYERRAVAAAVIKGLDAVIASPPVRAETDLPGLTLGQKAAVDLIEAAQTFEFAPPAPDATVTVLSIMRAGDVLVAAGNDANLAVRYAKELKKYLEEITARGQ